MTSVLLVKKEVFPKHEANMKNKNGLTIRYMGNDDKRLFCIQRGDMKFWTGKGFDKVLDKAKVYSDHKTAQLTCTALQYKQYKGKPTRKFRAEIEFTMVADNGQNISVDQLIKFIADAVRIDVDTAIHGDGPVDGSFVQAYVKLSSLEEVSALKEVF